MLHPTLCRVGPWLQNTETPDFNLDGSDGDGSRKADVNEASSIDLVIETWNPRDHQGRAEHNLGRGRARSSDRHYRPSRIVQSRETASLPPLSFSTDLTELDTLSVSNGSGGDDVSTHFDFYHGGLGQAEAMFGQGGPDNLDIDLFSRSDTLEEFDMQEELATKWILNQTLHIRDRGTDQKFLITWIQTPSRWRRLTVYMDYQGMEEGSLEKNINNMVRSEDKIAEIYRAVRSSLPRLPHDLEVANLFLKTINGELNIYVSEDRNEMVDYPSTTTLDYLECEIVPESEIQFECQETSFVYQIVYNRKLYIRKDISPSDQIDKLLFEINALHFLASSPHVISLHGLVVSDDDPTTIRGILLPYASRGTLYNAISNRRSSDPPIPWSRRGRWARQIVQGLAHIHAADLAHGDFTLDNIVIDDADAVKIIDINRRGLRVGWDPPELRPLIESRQDVWMYVGQKTDVWQLGMVLWALAELNGKPDKEAELVDASMRWGMAEEGLASGDVPDWYRAAFLACYCDDPTERRRTDQILGMFPGDETESG